MQAPHFAAHAPHGGDGKLARQARNRKVPLEEASGVLASMDNFGTVGVTVIDQY